MSFIIAWLTSLWAIILHLLTSSCFMKLSALLPFITVWLHYNSSNLHSLRFIVLLSCVLTSQCFIISWLHDASIFDFTMLHRVSDAPCFDFGFDFTELHHVADSSCFDFGFWLHYTSASCWFTLLRLRILNGLQRALISPITDYNTHLFSRSVAVRPRQKRWACLTRWRGTRTRITTS